MACPLTPVTRFAREFTIEKKDRLSTQRTVLRRPERQRVDTQTMTCIRRRTAKRIDCIGETCAVHMQFQAMPLADIGDRAQFGGCIERARFGHLCHAYSRWLRVVNDTGAGNRHLQGIWRQLSIRTQNRHQFGTTAKELRCTAFINIDMTFRMAIDGTIRWCHHRKRQRIRRRTRREKKNFSIRLEQFPQPPDRALCQRSSP